MRGCLFWTTFFLLLSGTHTYAADPVLLTSDQDYYRLGLHLDFLEDPQGDLTIREIVAPVRSGRFVPSAQQSPHFGFTDSVDWARLTVVNRNQSCTNWRLKIAHLYINDVRLFLPEGTGGRYTQKAHDHHPEHRARPAQ